MVASGNDFVVIDNSNKAIKSEGYKVLAKKICNRKFGIGADGLLVLENSKIADIRMRIFNADGSEASMCGNGSRCIALYISSKHRLDEKRLKIETKAGIIKAGVNLDNVKINLTDPTDIQLNIPVRVNGRLLRTDFINTGVPHAVIFVEGLDKIDVFNLGRSLRYHKRFKPEGTNVNFVEVQSSNLIKVRTYERGVEDETLACGTGATASAIILVYKFFGYPESSHVIKVKTKGAETLKVFFKNFNNSITDVWLEGKARFVCEGVYYV